MKFQNFLIQFVLLYIIILILFLCVKDHLHDVHTSIAFLSIENVYWHGGFHFLRVSVAMDLSCICLVLAELFLSGSLLQPFPGKSLLPHYPSETYYKIFRGDFRYLLNDAYLWFITALQKLFYLKVTTFATHLVLGVKSIPYITFKSYTKRFNWPICFIIFFYQH